MPEKANPMQIRTIEDKDWPAVWAIYQETVTAGESYAYDPAWTAEQARNVWLESPPGPTVVAVDGSRLLGTAKMGPNRPGRGAYVATASFMVASEARGRGVGRALGQGPNAASSARGTSASPRMSAATARVRGPAAGAPVATIRAAPAARRPGQNPLITAVRRA